MLASTLTYKSPATLLSSSAQQLLSTLNNLQAFSASYQPLTHSHPPPTKQPGAMSSSYHIPFPSNFLPVNTPVKKADVVDAAALQPEQFDHGFLSNRTVSRHSSVSSTSSVPEPAAVSAPPSPPVQAATTSVPAAPAFAPLALNAKHAAVPLTNFADMTPVARSAFLSNRGAGF